MSYSKLICVCECYHKCEVQLPPRIPRPLPLLSVSLDVLGQPEHLSQIQTNMPLCTKQNVHNNEQPWKASERNSVKVTVKCEIPYYSLIILEKIPLERPRHNMWQDIKISLRECVWSCELHYTVAQPTSYKAYWECYAAGQLWYVIIKNPSKISK
jgi:hypothetical protein